MRRIPRAIMIIIFATGILTMLGSILGNIGAAALTWLSPQLALVLLVLISLVLIGLALWQEGQKAKPETPAAVTHENRQFVLKHAQTRWNTGFPENRHYYGYDEQLLPLPLRVHVGSHFDSILSDPLKPTHPILSGTTITQVFDQAEGELLILGEPGAGKTTLLLKLADDLFQRARDNEEALIPVLLTLSSWSVRQ